MSDNFVRQTNKKEILVSRIVTVLYLENSSDFVFVGESHDFWEAVFVYDGHLTATADERVYQLSTGMLLLHKPMEFLRSWSAEDQESRFVNLSFRAGGMGIRRLEHCCFNLDEEQQKQLRIMLMALIALLVCLGVTIYYVYKLMIRAR